MLRDGRYKLLYSESDPPFLFDMQNDPAEMSNVAGDPACADRLAALMAEGAALWDASDIRARIIADQKRRRLIDRAHRMGRPPVWDYQPFVDASTKWVRAGKWTTEVEAQAHLDIR